MPGELTPQGPSLLTGLMSPTLLRPAFVAPRPSTLLRAWWACRTTTSAWQAAPTRHR